MTSALSDLLGVIAYPGVQDLDRALEEGGKTAGAGSALGVGKVLTLSQTTGSWAVGTSADTARSGVVPKLYWGKDINTDSSTKALVLTGVGAEVYVESSGTIPVGAKVQRGNAGTVKTWSTGTSVIGKYMGHYGEGSGFDQPATPGLTGEAVRIALETGELT